jgi:Flp pilus assembly protein TadG
MMGTAGPLRRALARFARSSGGNVAVMFSVAAPLLGLAVGVAVDYSRVLTAQRGLQNLVDHAALSGAQASRLGNATQNSIAQTVTTIVGAGSNGATISSTTTLTASTNSVTVKLDQDVALKFAALLGRPTNHLTATATARASGGSPLCMASLATTDPKLGAIPAPTGDLAGSLILAGLALDIALLPNPGILMLKGSKTKAPGCIISTNLPKTYSIAAYDTSNLTASSIQSGGGYVGSVGTNYSVTPTTDHPAATDPLAGLPMPAVGSCSYNSFKASGGAPSLLPGVYCGGLHITGGANATLMSGVYVIKDGSLTIDSGSTISGNGVGFFLTATAPVSNANRPTVYFGTDTHISVSAPTTGPMAGMLLFEDRAMPLGALHAILSNDARNLLGTIYLSRGFLGIAATKPISDQSAYTIIVVNALLAYGGPQLVLNTNYGSSTVPVPPGVGPNYNVQIGLSQ